MSFFGRFGKKSPSLVTAHILDPIAGYSKETWTVGHDVPQVAVEKLAEGDNLFVVVVYEAGEPNRLVCKRDIWNQTKSQFEAIESEGQASMSRMIDEINKLR